MMTCVSDRSGMASRVMFFIEYNPANVAIPMKRRTMNLFRAQNSIVLSIIASLLFLRWLMMRMIFGLGLCLRRLIHLTLRMVFRLRLLRRLIARLMLRVTCLRRCLAVCPVCPVCPVCRSAAAVIHTGHAHSARRGLQAAFGIDQEVG